MHRTHFATLLIVCLLVLPHFVFGQCSQTFSPSTVGTSPYPGDNVNRALQAARGGDVLCFASGAYGNIDLYGANPSGIVTIKPAAGATATVALFNLNGVHNLTITGFNGSSYVSSLEIIRAGTSDSTNVTFSGNEVKAVWVGLNQGTNTNILIQNNTMTNIGPLSEAAMVSDRNTGCPNGVVFKNNHINGALTDGFAPRGADCGTQWIGNEIENIQQSNCPGHCDGFQDKGGSVNQVIDGNYFHNVVNCGLTNDGTFNMTYKNNVCIPSSESVYAMQWTGNGMTFIHNTVIGNANTPILIGNTSSGQSTNFVEKDNIFFGGGQFVLNPGQTIGGTGWLNDYNLCKSSCSGSHSLVGVPTFVAGTNPTTYSGFRLTAGSVGAGAASDGKDVGISTTGSISSGPIAPQRLTANVN